MSEPQPDNAQRANNVQTPAGQSAQTPAGRNIETSAEPNVQTSAVLDAQESVQNPRVSVAQTPAGPNAQAPAAQDARTPTANATQTPVAQDAAGALPAASEPALNAETLRQLERICERLGADPQRSPQMARQLVKRAGQLARERDWSEAQALEHLLRLMLEASANGGGPQSPE